MRDFHGKVVVVTGAAGGLGRALCLRFGAAGARIVALDRDASALSGLLADLQAKGIAATVDRCDVSAASDCRASIAAAIGAFGGVDVLINNAGIFEPTPIDLPEAAWHANWAQVMQVNLYAPAELCKLAIPHFRRHGGGKIINVASRAAHRGDAPDQWPYAASKGGLVALTKTIARGFAKDNVLAFVIAPGFTDTEMAYTGLDDAGVERIIADIPLGSMVRPEECGALAAFLCTDEVRHMTGATFDVNGASYVR